jgi:hypothetical protein
MKTYRAVLNSTWDFTPMARSITQKHEVRVEVTESDRYGMVLNKFYIKQCFGTKRLYYETFKMQL